MAAKVGLCQNLVGKPEDRVSRDAAQIFIAATEMNTIFSIVKMECSVIVAIKTQGRKKEQNETLRYKTYMYHNIHGNMIGSFPARQSSR